MPKYHLDKKSLRFLYENFSMENDLVSAIMKKPEYIIIIRLSKGLSQTAFENLVRMSKNLYKYESGKIKPTKKTAEKFLFHFKELEPWEIIAKNFERLSSESNGWFAANSGSKKALKARKKGAENQMKTRNLTPQENEIANKLNKLGLAYLANTKIGKIFVDFFIPELKIAVECKRLTTKNRREHMKKVKEAAFQGYKTKFYNKEVRLAVVFESSLRLNENERQELCGPYDYIFEKVNDIEYIIKGQTI